MQACISHNISASLSISSLRQVLLSPPLSAALAYTNEPRTEDDTKEGIHGVEFSFH
jgi:hypothetical protein